MIVTTTMITTTTINTTKANKIIQDYDYKLYMKWYNIVNHMMRRGWLIWQSCN